MHVEKNCLNKITSHAFIYIYIYIPSTSIDLIDELSYILENFLIVRSIVSCTIYPLVSVPPFRSIRETEEPCQIFSLACAQTYPRSYVHVRVISYSNISRISSEATALSAPTMYLDGASLVRPPFRFRSRYKRKISFFGRERENALFLSSSYI